MSILETTRDWWNGREPRERLLLGVLGLIAGLFVLLFAIVLPLLDARDRADRALERAEADYRIVARTARVPAAGATARAPFDRAALLSAARAQGLQVTRIQPGPEGGFSVWIDEAETAALYGMFDVLLTDHAAAMKRVSVSADANGGLSAQFTIAQD